MSESFQDPHTTDNETGRHMGQPVAACSIYGVPDRCCGRRCRLRGPVCTTQAERLPNVVRSLCTIVVPPITSADMDGLNGDFNIAVAAFTELNAEGRAVATNKGRYLAQEFAAALQPRLEALDSSIRLDFWGPDQTGFVAGATEQEQEDNAARLAREADADLLLYGNLAINPDASELQPSVYLAPDQLAYAEEMAGVYRLDGARCGGKASTAMPTPVASCAPACWRKWTGWRV